MNFTRAGSPARSFLKGETMYVRSEQASGSCDTCDKGKATIGYVAKGATGRNCEVLWICEDCVAEGAEIKDAQAARDIINARPGEWADF
jgi:hypothetical protein